MTQQLRLKTRWAFATCWPGLPPSASMNAENGPRTGRKIRTPRKLKRKWAVAALFAEVFIRVATSREVVVVPRFAPKMMAITCVKLMSPAETKPMVARMVMQAPSCRRRLAG